MQNFSRTWLIDRIANGYKPDFLLFWGHTSSDNHTIGSFMLSQWYPSSFTVGGLTYPTAEHWMMAGKASLMGDWKTHAAIMQAVSAKEAKALGRKVEGFDSDLWNKHAYQIVIAGNEQKFLQSPPCRNFLLSTGDKVIVEASPVDDIWGSGHAENHASARNSGQWRGQNLLGFALMEVRERLRKTL